MAVKKSGNPAIAKLRTLPTKKIKKSASIVPQQQPATLPATFSTPLSRGIQMPATTGRYIVIYKNEAFDHKTVRKSLLSKAGIKDVPTSQDFKTGALSADLLAGKHAIHFSKLGIVLISNEDEMMALAASVSDATSPIFSIEPEYLAYPINQHPSNSSMEYIRGYRDGINQLYASLTDEPGNVAEILRKKEANLFHDTNEYTWGLQMTGVSNSKFCGRDVKVATLDTGIDLHHKDFKGRLITTQSFSGETVDDINSHGTHCIGTSCGPQKPASGVRRYGIAYGAHIFAGKVFNNEERPSAPTANVIAGLEWALNNDCNIASLSLGVSVNQKIAQYETSLRRALNAGLLVVAAAGNNAIRPDEPGFVEPPANSKSAMAVAAIDNQSKIANFSARSSQIPGDGGKVDIVAPGVGVFSSVISAMGNHAFFDGTSMATQHVAGIAALWAEATREKGTALWARLIQSVKPLSLSSIDVGAGLVQAPH